MRIGIIGYGSIGKRHVRNLTTLGIRDILLLRTKRLGNEYGLKELESFDELIKSTTTECFCYIKSFFPTF